MPIFMTEVRVRQRQFVIETNLDEAITAVRLIGWDNIWGTSVSFDLC